MAETKIIPIELKALICSHLLARYDRRYLEYFGMSPYDERSLAAVTGVLPLDIPDVRKTQRRVAALLGRDPVDIFPNRSSHRHKHGCPTYTDSEVHSIRKLLGEGTKRAHRQPVQVPLAPQNSFLGNDEDNCDDSDRTNNDDDDDGCDNDVANLFDTSIFHDTTDPNIFKLPSIFAGGSPPAGSKARKKRHSRVVPTVSEQTFIDCNLRRPGYYTDRYDSSSSNGHYNSHHHSPSVHYVTAAAAEEEQEEEEEGEVEEEEEITTKVLLPSLDPNQRNLISRKMEGVDGVEGDRIRYNNGAGNTPTGRRSKEEGSRNEEVDDMTSSMMRMMSLEPELTRAGSLLIDENFVPMSVTITRLSQDADEVSQVDGQGHSPPLVLPGPFKEKIRTTKSINSKNVAKGSSSTSKKKKEIICCSCKEPRPILIPSTIPCPCCLRTGGQHETGCPQKTKAGSKKGEVTLLCNLCGKLISSRKRKEKGSRREKEETSRKLSGSGYTRNPMTPETAINRFHSYGSADFHNRRICSSGSAKKPEGTESSFRTENGDSDPAGTSVHRVRFDENVKTLEIFPHEEDGEQGVLEIKDNYEDVSGKGDTLKSSLKSKKKKLFVKRKDFIVPKIGQSVNIPNLGVSVHAMAYDLALKDARVLAASKRKGRTGQGTQSGEISNGTIFSYFPLLKRPLSENDKTDIGLKARDAKKVKAKNYMKHIFGKVNLSDYYPGGKKWREV